MRVLEKLLLPVLEGQKNHTVLWGGKWANPCQQLTPLQHKINLCQKVL